MPDKTYRLVEEQEYERRLEEVAARAARQAANAVVEELDDEITRLRSELHAAAAARDLVPEGVLKRWLGVRRRTLRRWDIPIACKKGMTCFYDMDEVEAHIRETGTPID